MSAIRTPDQRLRVFISSTIEELKEERLHAREAIASLRLTPVFFEAGARPHPPRELYRAYLEQSDIFVGVYARSYGWVAPGMTVSGLEDEYLLSAGRPQLIYIKEIEGERDTRMEELLNSIRRNENVSYQKFRTPEQLAELLRNDLALLLSERFVERQDPQRSNALSLPAIRSVTIGRDAERTAIKDLLLRPDVGLLTLTGAGGTGKSHLALRVAHDVLERFPDGACLVPLASIQRAEQVLPALAHALRIPDSGTGDLLEQVVDQLRGRSALVVIDNFEHVLDAAPLLADLLDRLPGSKWLVTSRSPLHLSGEHVYAVPPLHEPPADETDTRTLLANPAVELFVKRAEAHAAPFTLDEHNVGAIAELCRRLDGLPLAIELAAAHTRYFTPVALAARLNRSLDMLERGSRDLPERQRTMRAAIAASHDLLDEAHRAFFRRLAVFSERWTIEAARAVAAPEGSEIDAMTAVERLADMGLVRAAPVLPFDPDDGTRFTMLHVVREFAKEELDRHEERRMCMQRLLGTCLKLAQEAAELERSRHENVFMWLDRVAAIFPDIRAVARDAIDRKDPLTVWQLVAQLNTFWLLRGYRGEAMDWLRQADFEGLLTRPEDYREVPALLRGGVLLAAGAMSYYAEHQLRSIDYLRRAEEAFKEAGDPPVLRTYAMLFRGLAHTGHDDPEANEVFEELLRSAQASGDASMVAVARCYRNETLVRRGQLEQATADLDLVAPYIADHPSSILRASYHLARANLLLYLDRMPEATDHYRISAEITRRTRIVGTLGWSLCGLGICQVREGDLAEGHATFAEGLALSRQGGYKAAVMAFWAGLAWVAALRADHVRGARILGAVHALQETIAYAPWTSTRFILKAAQSAIGAGLEPAVMEREMAAGARLPAEEVHLLAVA